jgi:hypothetical protein
MFAGLPEGSKLSLRGIKDAVSNDPAYQNMSEKDKDDARALLLAHRNTKATAARVSNASAARDVSSTMAIQDREVCVLFARFSVKSSMTLFNGRCRPSRSAQARTLLHS